MKNSLKIEAAALCGVPLFAHDMWIRPTTFSPQTGEIVSVRLLVGQDFMGDPIARDSGLIRQFLVQDAAERKPLVGRDGSNPAGYLRIAIPGLLVIGYYSNPSPVDLPAEKFNQYLKDEGLDGIAALRARRKETGAGVHEIFTRCAKSLVLSGAPDKAQGDRTVGFPLELVAERNPYIASAGGDLPIRLTYEIRPLTGALVIAMSRQNPAEKLTAGTDRNGRVHFRLGRERMWLIKAVHMIPAPAGSNAQWASYWASLTFELKS